MLGRQMGDRQLLIDAFKKASKACFRHLMIDCDSHTDPKLKLCSNCSGTGLSVFLNHQATPEKTQPMSQQELYMFEFFVKMKPIVRLFYLSHCSKEGMKFSQTVFLTLSVGILQWLRMFPKKT